MDMPEMAVSYWVENQAGERVGVENHPGSNDSGRQCRPLKGFMRDVAGKNDCGLVCRRGNVLWVRCRKMWLVKRK